MDVRCPLFRVLLFRGIAWTAKEPVDRFNNLVWPDADISRSQPFLISTGEIGSLRRAPRPVDASQFRVGCPMKQTMGWQTSLLLWVSLAGCHFRAGLGPPPHGAPSVDHSVIRDTVEGKDGVRNTTETDKTTTTFDDGRSTTLETVNVIVTQPDGATSRSSTQTTTERSPNGSVSSSSSTSSSN